MHKIIIWAAFLCILCSFSYAISSTDILAIHTFDTNVSNQTTDYAPLQLWNLTRMGDAQLTTALCANSNCTRLTGKSPSYFEKVLYINSSYYNNTGFSICFWITFHQNTTGSRYIFKWGSGAPVRLLYYPKDWGGSGGIRNSFYWQTSTSDIHEWKEVSFNVKDYMCFVHNQTNDTVYVNGKLNQTFAFTGNTFASTDADARYFRIGDDAGGGNPLNATIDEFYIFNKTGGLNLADIQYLYNNGVGHFYPFSSEAASSNITAIPYISPSSPNDDDDLLMYCNSSTNPVLQNLTYHYEVYKNGGLFANGSVISNSTINLKDNEDYAYGDYCNGCSLAYDENWDSGAAWNFAPSAKMAIYENFTLPTTINTQFLFSYGKCLWGGCTMTTDGAYLYFFNHSSGLFSLVWSDATTITNATNVSVSIPTWAISSENKISTKFLGGYTSGARYAVYNEGGILYQSASLQTGNKTLVYIMDKADTTAGDNITLGCNILYNSTDYSNFTYTSVYISGFNVSSCSAAYPFTLLNVSFFEENNKSVLRCSVDGYFATSYNNYSLLMNNISNFTICSNINITGNVNSYFSYICVGGITERYYINATYPVDNPNLYLHNFEDATGLSTLTGLVYNYYYTDYPNLYMKLQRFYPSEYAWRTVQMDKTDEFGKGIFYVYQLTKDYRFVFSDDTRTLYTTSANKFSCETATSCEQSYIIPQTSEATSYAGMGYYSTYINATGMYSFTWSDTNNLVSSVRLLAEQIKPNQIITICDTTIASSSGTILCNISSYTGTVKITAWRSASPAKAFFSEWIDRAVEQLKDLLTGANANEGMFLSFMITIVLVGFGAATGSPVVLVIFAVLGQIINTIFGFANVFSWAIAIGFAALGIVVMYMVKE